MTDLLFNELLDVEAAEVARFYTEATHYEPYEYVRIVADGPEGTAVSRTVTINPGDRDLKKLMRRLGARYALDQGKMDPMAIFVVQPSISIQVAEDGLKLQERTITIYGITNDGRYNLAVLPVQWDEDNRLYAAPTHLYHWGADGTFSVDAMPYLEFFRVNDDVRLKVPA